MEWFEVDRRGLAKLLEAKGKSFAILELVQNAWDADGVTNARVTLKALPNVSRVHLTIEDDSPVGFANLAHAWTLFAESNRKGDSEKRGRFNLGEKLVLALCDSASIMSTTGTVLFDENGRHRGRTKRESGSCFDAVMRMTRAELEESIAILRRLIPPTGITTTVNDEPIGSPQKERSVHAYLATERADENGVLRQTWRGTEIDVYEANGDGWLYELGIPVVATGDRWHYNINQKVPLNFNRDNVTPSYLRDVRAAVVSEMADLLNADDVKSEMVTSVMDRVTVDAAKRIIAARFGEDAVVYDPSDIEANKIAMSEGRQVIYGNAFSAAAWDNIRKSGAVLPAGQVTPSPRPFSPDGAPLEVIDPSDYSPEMRRAARYIESASDLIVGGRVAVVLTADRRWSPLAAYGDRRLHVNVRRVDVTSRQAVNEIIIHEFAHEWISDHLSNAFHEKCCEIGAKLVEISLAYQIMWGVDDMLAS